MQFDSDLIFKALASPIRRQILEWLKHPEQYFAPNTYRLIDEQIGVCAGQFDLLSHLSQSTMSNHLSVLQRAGLITAHKHGQWCYFSRNEALIQHYLQFLQQTL
jgi:DNA-binding transcriptional ArsR family regulator